MPSKRVYFLAIIAVCLLFVQAAPYLSARWVEDESWYGSVGYTFFHDGQLRNPMFPPMDTDAIVDMRPPATPLTAGMALRLFGMNSARARAPFLLAGLGTVIVVFFIGLELSGPLAGGIAALLLATDNLFFLTSRTVRPEALVIFWGSLGVLLFLMSRGRGKWGVALAAGISLGIALDCHPNGLGALAAVGLFILMEYKLRFLATARFWAVAVGVLIGVGPFLGWAMSSPRNREATIAMYTKGQGPTLGDIPKIEQRRYADFLGFGARKAGLPVAIPYRLHIGLAILAAFWVLWRYKRELFWRCVVLIFPCTLLWALQRHPTTRYIAVAAPWFAILIATAGLRLAEVRPPLRKVAFAAIALVFVTQLGGNAVLLYGFRNADYNQVTRKLRAVIPPGSGIYGAVTFWLALYDYPYASWNRTPLNYAVSQEHVSYLILNDRVLLNGSGFGNDDWAAKRVEADEFVRDHATLVGNVDNSFYGDLRIYRVNTPASAH